MRKYGLHLAGGLALLTLVSLLATGALARAIPIAGEIGSAGRTHHPSASPPDAPSGPAAIADPHHFIWHTETVDQAGWGGTSLDLDTGDHPHIGYYDWVLRYAWNDGTGWVSETVDASGNVGYWPSLALDALDRPHIAYRDMTHRSLKYAWNDGTGWSSETVDDASGNVGGFPSIAVDENNLPRISYCDFTARELRYAWYDGFIWHIETVDAAAPSATENLGRFSSLAMDTLDHPHISYHDDNSSSLRYAWFNGVDWVTETVDVGGDPGQYSSLALDNSNRPHISYHRGYPDYDLAYAVRDCGWLTETVDSEGLVGVDTSLELDGAGRPYISYRDWTSGWVLKLAWHDGSAWHVQTVDQDGNVGASSSLELDTLDRPHISHFDNANLLKYTWGEPAHLVYLPLLVAAQPPQR